MPKESWDDWYARTGAEQLRELAREVWDAVGIGTRTPAHELDRYLPDLADAARRSDSAEELAGYLTTVEHRYFVANRNEEELLPAARKILAWYRQAAGGLG